MSGITDRLLEDQKAAMRARDEIRLSAIRMIRSALQNAQIAKNAELTDVEATEVIAREVRQRREGIEEATKAGRPELVQKGEAELKIVLSYLPHQLNKDEIEVAARRVIAEVGARGPGDRGRVMSKLMPALRGQADGRSVSAVVEELLGK